MVLGRRAFDVLWRRAGFFAFIFFGFFCFFSGIIFSNLRTGSQYSRSAALTLDLETSGSSLSGDLPALAYGSPLQDIAETQRLSNEMRRTFPSPTSRPSSPSSSRTFGSKPQNPARPAEPVFPGSNADSAKDGSEGPVPVSSGAADREAMRIALGEALMKYDKERNKGNPKEGAQDDGLPGVDKLMLMLSSMKNVATGAPGATGEPSGAFGFPPPGGLKLKPNPIPAVIKPKPIGMGPSNPTSTGNRRPINKVKFD